LSHSWSPRSSCTGGYSSPTLHVALAAVAFAASLVLAAATYRGEPAPRSSWRDYVTLTKPRIMSLLLVTGLCAMFVGAQGAPRASLVLITMTGLALACGVPPRSTPSSIATSTS
jgi:protoheme IX farnesyltransferase